MSQKIMFFDIDGTLIPEHVPNARIPESTIRGIRQARKNGHLMFINSGRCMQNMEPRFLEIGFDGVVAGCGTNIYHNEKELYYCSRDPQVCRTVLELARDCDLEIIFEAKDRISYDHKMRYTANGLRVIRTMRDRGYDLSENVDRPGFAFDKFMIWKKETSRLEEFLEKISPWYHAIDRGGYAVFECVPNGHSKATGIRFLLDYFHLPLSAAYAVGDSNNDLAMLEYVPGSIAMGNSTPSLFDKVSYITDTVDHDGIEKALRHFEFI